MGKGKRDDGDLRTNLLEDSNGHAEWGSNGAAAANKSDDFDISNDEGGGENHQSTEDAAAQRKRNVRFYTSSSIPSDVGKGPELESLDFDTINNPYWVDLSRRPPRKFFGYTGKTFTRWTLSILIGLFVALTGNFIAFMIENLSAVRNSVLQSLFDSEQPDSHAFVFFVLYNGALVLMGALLTATVEPAAAAGGIPEIKAYLNGTHVKNFLRLRAIFVKVVGTILSVASGMACGQEAPMIHIGAGIASGLTRGEKHFRKLMCFKLSKPKKFESNLLRKFHNDRDRREFICAGAGAGMAAAFGAPVGGVLFVLEEAASHWSPQLIWRVFAAALVATFTLAFVKAGENGGDISLAGLLSFGTVQSVEDMKRQLVSSDGSVKVSAVDAPVYWWEIVFFALVGVGGGILGGLWDLAWNAIAPFRPKGRVMRVVEVVMVSVFTSAVVFSQAYSYPQCRNNGSWSCRDSENWGDWCGGPQDNSTCSGARAKCVNASGWVCQGGENSGKACRGRGDCEWRGGVCMPMETEEIFGVRLGCPVGQYDELATIFFGTREQSIVRLFTQASPREPFSNSSLTIAGLTYMVLMLFTYGCAIPAGLFMPSVMVGACLGRLVGQLVKQYVESSVFSGAYALAGAAAMLSGVQRATISLVVIIIEGTANVHFLLPIVVTTCTAKLVGNLFGHEGVYEIGLRRKKLRFLEHEPHWMMDLCTAGDVMSTPVVCLPVVAKVGEIIEKLKGCGHNGFPVLSLTDEGDEGAGPRQQHERSPVNDCKFEGLILRAQLQHMLGARFLEDGADPQGLWHRITYDSLEHLSLDGDPDMYELMAYNNRQGASGLQAWEFRDFSPEDRERYVNLGAYMNCSCYTVLESCPLSRAYKLFRNMGLRHLPVVDVQNRVVGMLARANFSEEVIHQAMTVYYHDDEIHQHASEEKNPRLKGYDTVSRQLNRHALYTEEGGYIGGLVTTWQTRLAFLLRGGT
uniref:Chloride channel protein n=1 Tax=Guillardia theta TaxID=55529 RepID=A0A7S4KVL4_GUITH|mmetsp:Transcript_31478/g.100748  ORF Transcript_31478/g.100748 Transcript_31478/m.100748 type:complete len:970 (+) Transcript_31478:199-3108(+)